MNNTALSTDSRREQGKISGITLICWPTPLWSIPDILQVSTPIYKITLYIYISIPIAWCWSAWTVAAAWKNWPTKSFSTTSRPVTSRSPAVGSVRYGILCKPCCYSNADSGTRNSATIFGESCLPRASSSITKTCRLYGRRWVLPSSTVSRIWPPRRFLSTPTRTCISAQRL